MNSGMLVQTAIETTIGLFTWDRKDPGNNKHCFMFNIFEKVFAYKLADNHRSKVRAIVVFALRGFQNEGILQEYI